MLHLKLRGYILSTLFLVLCSISFADNLPEYVEKASIYSFSEDLKNIIYRNYDEGTVHRTLLERNQVDGKIENAVYQLQLGTDAWENISKHAYLYDEQGVQTSDVFYVFSGNGWHPVSKENYLFDDSGNLLLKEPYQYLSASSSWMGTGEKIEREYNAMNQCTKYTVHTWINGNWKPLSEGTMTYSNNLPFSNVYRYRNGVNGELENSSHIVYSYTGIDLPDTEIYQSWNNNAWKDAIKITYTNAGGMITSKIIQYINSENVYEFLTKYEYEYIDNVLSKIIKSEREAGKWKEAQTVKMTRSGNDVSVEEIGESDSVNRIYKYDPVNADNYYLYTKKEEVLTGIIGYQYFFDGNYLPSGLIKYNWSEEIDDWQPARVNSWTIDKDGKTDRVIFRQREASKEAFELKKEIEFIFGSNLSTDKKSSNALRFEIFPNPVKEGFVIQLSEMSNPTDYYIYNTMGRLVTRGKVSGPQQYVDASKLPAGQYIITVVSETEKASSVILKL